MTMKIIQKYFTIAVVKIIAGYFISKSTEGNSANKIKLFRYLFFMYFCIPLSLGDLVAGGEV